MAPRPGELEVLIPLADGGGEHVAGDVVGDPEFTSRPRSRRARSRPRRRWSIAVLAAMIAAVAVAVPVRTRLGRSEMHWLDRQWARSLADDNERSTVEQRLKSYSSVADPQRLSTALAALYREEGQRLRSTRSRLGQALLVDLRLAAVRSDVVTALSHRADLLERVAVWYGHSAEGPIPPTADNQTAADTNRVDHDLRTARTHWGQKETKGSLPATPFASATVALAGLSRWFDQPLGTSLLSVSGSQLLRLDIDASRAVPIGGISISDGLVARQGYLAFHSDVKIWAVAPDGSGTPRFLAAGQNVFPAARPDAIWTEDPSTLAVNEIDGSGRLLVGPLSVPGPAYDATSKALIVSLPDNPGIAIWDVDTRRVTCLLGTALPPGRSPFAADAFPWELATNGDLVVWADSSLQLHVTDATTCNDRLHFAPPASQPQDSQVFFPGRGPAVAFSPDGRTLAVAGGATPDGGVNTLDLIDIASGHVTLVPIEARGPIYSIAWTADGSRLFWLSVAQPGLPALIDTWRMGDPRAQVLRVIDLRLDAPLLVIPK